MPKSAFLDRPALARAPTLFRFACTALAGAAISMHAAAAPLSPIEQRLAADVRARSGEAIRLLEEAVNINSGTMNHAGIRQVGKLYRAELEALGFKTSWIELPTEMSRAGHLVATREGKQGKRLLLLGHLDTVFEADSPVKKWERKGDRVSGQGVTDMKGGNLIILEALRALHKEGALDNTSITVMFTGDEEEPGKPTDVSRADMVRLAKASDMVLAWETTVLDKDGKATATVGRRASSMFRLDVKGKQGHSQGVFSAGAGYGAIYEAARILDGFRVQVAETDLTYNPGIILGGTQVDYNDMQSAGTAAGKTNVIANTVTVKGDIRYLDYPQRDRAHKTMRDIVSKNLPGTSASIQFYESYPPMAATAGNLKILDIYSQVSEDAGLGPIKALPAGQRGAGDIQFVAPFKDTLDGLGASGKGAHAPDEELEIASIERGAVRAAILLYRLTR
jgi:glutamate carboxypeptidase